MRKIRLRVQDLAVESFVAAPPAPGARGTVRGRVTGDPGGECATLGIDPTCLFHASCDPNAECDGTAYDNTCPGMNDC